MLDVIVGNRLLNKVISIVLGGVYLKMGLRVFFRWGVVWVEIGWVEDVLRFI